MIGFWIKLYIEFLDDIKIGELPEYLQLRFIKLLLVAKEYDQDGKLPPVSALAWRLRTDAGSMSETLSALGLVGVVQETDPGSWMVVNFAKRQFSESYARVKRFRNKLSNVTPSVTRNGGCNGSETLRDRGRGEEEIEIEGSAGDQFFTEIMTLTGLMATANDIPVMQKWEQDGVIADDIRDAFQWRKDNGKPPVKTIAQLSGGVDTARRKRVQGNNAKPGSGGKPTLADQGYKEFRHAGS